jgi:hypothetical protein
VPSAGSTRDFQTHLVQALLTRLKPAYASFEAKSVDSYFELIVHLSADHPHLIQRTLEVVLELLDDFALSKLESDSPEQLGHVQKLLGFLGTVFASAVAVPASQQHSFGAAEALFRPGRTSHPDRLERSASRNRAPQVHEAIAESREEGKDDPEREDTEEEDEEEDLISFGEEDDEEEVGREWTFFRVCRSKDFEEATLELVVSKKKEAWRVEQSKHRDLRI